MPRSRWLSLGFLTVAIAAPFACGQSGSGGGSPAASPTALPSGLATALPVDSAGRPIVAEIAAAGLPPGVALALVHDDTKNDPITRWAGCMGVVLGCYGQNGGYLKGCNIPVCGDPKGGDDCCPGACVDRYKSALASTKDEDQAVAASFQEGSCVPGFVRPANAAMVMP